MRLQRIGRRQEIGLDQSKAHYRRLHGNSTIRGLHDRKLHKTTHLVHDSDVNVRVVRDFLPKKKARVFVFDFCLSSGPFTRLLPSIFRQELLPFSCFVWFAAVPLRAFKNSEPRYNLEVIAQ